MYRKEINTLRKIVQQVGFIYKKKLPLLGTVIETFSFSRNFHIPMARTYSEIVIQ